MYLYNKKKYGRFLPKNVKKMAFSLKDTLSGALSGGLQSGLSGAIGGLLSNVFGQIGQGKQQQAQLNMQKELLEQSAAINYKYGEMAAENAYKRQMEMYERSYQDQSYSAMRKQMEDAGLSVGLMYGGSGSGGGSGAMSGAPMGATGTGGAGQADSPAAQKMANMKVMEVGLAMQAKKAEIDLIKAQTNQADANAEKTREDAETNRQTREGVVEKLRQEGFGTWVDAISKKYELEGQAGQEYEVVNSYTGDRIKVETGTYLSQARTAEILNIMASTAKTDAEKKGAEAMAQLTNEKAKGYVQELANATLQANADAIYKAVSGMVAIKNNEVQKKLAEIQAYNAETSRIEAGTGRENARINRINAATNEAKQRAEQKYQEAQIKLGKDRLQLDEAKMQYEKEIALIEIMSKTFTGTIQGIGEIIPF